MSSKQRSVPTLVEIAFTFCSELSVAPNLVKNRFQSEKPVRVFHTLTLTEKKSNKYISDFKTQTWTSLSCKVPNKGEN